MHANKDDNKDEKIWPLESSDNYPDCIFSTAQCFLRETW